jgi:hypothetical protein
MSASGYRYTCDQPGAAVEHYRRPSALRRYGRHLTRWLAICAGLIFASTAAGLAYGLITGA